MAKVVGLVQGQEPQNISDPACGSGRTLIAFDRNCPPGTMNFYVGVDVDPRCVRIAAINFFFHGMRGVLICGNSLSLEARFGYRVWLPEMGMGIEHLDAANCQKYLAIPKRPGPQLSKGKTFEEPGKQLQLF